MTFVQMIDCKTSRVDEMNRLMDRWIQATQGKRTATHAIVGRDRSDSTHVVEIVEFPSYAEAMHNSQLPETDRIFQELVALCDELPTFTDLDVVRDEQLNKETARRVFGLISLGTLDALHELIADDYQKHDPASRTDPIGLEESKDELRGYIEAFHPQFTIEDQVADGDLVTTRWTVHGRHTGEFLGVEPTDNSVTVTGHTTHRFQDSKIVEAWLNWDQFGLFAQLGILEQ
ncbi:ester cyclase [Streptomyces gobiensis]|uniref:ester cyclase n=1 Tax=Streptomyces gobiensis TaxID=2875706 RepID=UPI001E38A392|nr:ester cyclase [Streptomyces gobiensis]UGY93162.1 ester cyclase [Streptomyces gobiensis]